MKWHSKIEPVFVENVPDTLDGGRLYVSMVHATTIHLCCCGCGEEVVTPLSPTDWKLTYDGEAVSLWPSIGNWNSPCRSHYIIKDNRVLRAGSWSAERVANEQARDRRAKAAYYGQGAPVDRPSLTPQPPPVPPAGILDQLKRWWRGH